MSVITKKKPFEKIIDLLNKHQSLQVVVIGCDKCAKISETGGTQQVKEMKNKLKDIGYKLLEIENLPDAIEEGLCDKEAVRKKIKNLIELKDQFQILVLACGAGLKCIKDLLMEPIIVPGLETLGPGVKGELACLACGDCQFDNNGCKMINIINDQLNRLRLSYLKT